MASPADASGPFDKRPVLAQHAEPEAFIDRERFTPSRFLDGNPTVQLERYHVGKPSLSGEPECLSLHTTILPALTKSGKEAALPPLAEAQRYPRRRTHENSEYWYRRYAGSASTASSSRAQRLVGRHRSYYCGRAGGWLKHTRIRPVEAAPSYYVHTAPRAMEAGAPRLRNQLYNVCTQQSFRPLCMRNASACCFPE